MQISLGMMILLILGGLTFGSWLWRGTSQYWYGGSAYFFVLFLLQLFSIVHVG